MRSLELTRDEIEKASAALGGILARYQEGLRERPVFPRLDREALEAILAEPLPEEGRPVRALLEEFEEVLLPNSTQIPHPRFLAYINASPTGVAPFAEALAASLNQNCTLWKLSPAANAVERKLVAWFAGLFGLPGEAGGLITSGGSAANLTALAAARNRHFEGDLRRQGLQGRAGAPLTLYTSTEVHNSVDKAVMLLGLGTDHIRRIETDEDFRIRVDRLRETVRRDRTSGFRPFCVVANAGTIATGTIDPLDDLADLCAEERLWLHVDGAYGAFTVLGERMRGELLPAGRGDSLTLDPHKLLFNPMEAGCVLVRDARSLRETFRFVPDYYSLSDDPMLVDFTEYGPQLSRSFKALKVWWALRAFGRRAYAETIDGVLDLAAYLGERVDAEADLERTAPVHTTAVCFRHRRLDEDGNRGILERLVEEGTAFLSMARLRGRYTLRACFNNFRTRREDVDAVVEEVLRLGREIAGGRSIR
jgi:aromatic-L-amino-acid decarboxylase